ncbi:MAG: OadG family transporter subunit [Actinomycetia bacterium]|nr:OadG family transporter subunit [Actinomycetes bacterium]
MHTEHLGWGGWMTVAGMGMVFAILILLTLALWLIGYADAQGMKRAQKAEALAAAAAPAAAELPAEPAEPEAPAVATTPSGLTVDQLAAISVAVVTHARVRRNQAAPAMRAHEPGSLLHASRWVSSGRSTQTTPWRRS